MDYRHFLAYFNYNQVEFGEGGVRIVRNNQVMIKYARFKQCLNFNRTRVLENEKTKIRIRFQHNAKAFFYPDFGFILLVINP